MGRAAPCLPAEAGTAAQGADVLARIGPGRRRRRRPGERAWADRFAAGSIEELRHARAFVATLVVDYGEWILPIFQRLDEECERRETRVSSMDRVRQLAGARA